MYTVDINSAKRKIYKAKIKTMKLLELSLN